MLANYAIEQRIFGTSLTRHGATSSQVEEVHDTLCGVVFSPCSLLRVLPASS